MQVKTFEATRMKDAISAVKRELGHDAVILSTKEHATKGPGGGKMYEVTAAAAVQSRNAGATAAKANANSEMQNSHLDLIEKQVSSLVERGATSKQARLIESGVQELKMILLEALRDDRFSLIREVPMHLHEIYKTLQMMGIEPATLAELMQQLKGLPDPEAVKKTNPNPQEYYRAEAIRWMMKRIKITPKLAITPGAPSVHVLVGPSGVGKTTMIAKLASFYALKEKVPTLILSFDNDKVAGSEQLRVFSKIIGVPFATIAEPSQLQAKIQEHKNPELILIDTASRNPRLAPRLDDLEYLKSLPFPVDFHLLLSTTERHDHLENAIRYFSGVGLHSLMFAKLDECWSYGDIFNLSQRWTLPLSFFSTGAEVPEDLERASRERVVERIFGI